MSPVRFRREEVDTSAWVKVTPGMVRRVGPSAAIVLATITFRTAVVTRDTVEHDESTWWPVSVGTLGELTGLSRQQIRTAITRLVDEGHIALAELHLGGWADRTKAYRPLFLDEEPLEEVPPGATESGPPRLSATTAKGYQQPLAKVASNNCSSSLKNAPEDSCEELVNPTLTRGADEEHHPLDGGGTKPATDAQRAFLTDIGSLGFDDATYEASRPNLTGADADAIIRATWGEVESALMDFRYVDIDTLTPRMRALAERRLAG